LLYHGISNECVWILFTITSHYTSIVTISAINNKWQFIDRVWNGSQSMQHILSQLYNTAAQLRNAY
jgi:hypothetical protein